MVREIRDGRNVNIYSSDTSSSLRGSDYFDWASKEKAASHAAFIQQAGDTKHQESIKYPVSSDL